VWVGVSLDAPELRASISTPGSVRPSEQSILQPEKIPLTKVTALSMHTARTVVVVY
jgi:hypothetical protein